jgi:CHAT domain-containing protein
MVAGAGVLRLRLDIRASALSSIPWEIINDGTEYLTLGVRTPLVRYLHDSRSPGRLEHCGPLNVLLVAATPNDLAPLPGISRELETIRSTFANAHGDRKVHRVDTIEHATSRQLHGRLNHEYQVAHFMGHGTFTNNRGYLLFEDDEHQANWKEAETIGDLLKNNAIRVLLLNACDTAIPSSEESLIGVAQAAHAAGVPVVVAMQSGRFR